MIRQFTKDFRIIQNADRLAERIFLLITVAFVGFIVLASLTGPHPKYKLSSTALVQLIKLPSSDSVYTYHDLGDISSNVLFYIPLGLFLSFVVSFRKPGFLTPWLAAGFLLSAAMEVSQYFVGRYPDPVDLLTNTVGYVFGFELGVFAIKYFGLRPSAVIGINADEQTTTKLNTIASIRFFYIAVYLISSFLPFDLSFHPSAIYAKLHPDRYGQIRLILDPFYHLYRWGHDAHNIGGLLIGLLPVGVLSGVMAGFRRKLYPSSPVVTCFLLAVASELGQIFIVSRVSDIVMIPLAVLAGIFGWLFALAWFMLQDSGDSSFFKGTRERNLFLWSLIGGYILLLLFSTLSPYRFEYSLKAVEQKLLFQSNLMPLRSHLSVHSEDSSFAILRGIGAFIPLGLFLTFALKIYKPSWPRWGSVALVSAIAMAVAFFLELIKVTGVGYYCDITYVILAAMGGAVGGILFKLLSHDR
jgi:glycopeptide antibiotics resistance protein